MLRQLLSSKAAGASVSSAGAVHLRGSWLAAPVRSLQACMGTVLRQLAMWCMDKIVIMTVSQEPATDMPERFAEQEHAAEALTLQRLSSAVAEGLSSGHERDQKVIISALPPSIKLSPRTCLQWEAASRQSAR